MLQNSRGAHQDETDISTPELVQNMLEVKDRLSRSNPSQKKKLWWRVLVGVLYGALVVTIIWDLSRVVGGGYPADTVPRRNHTTTQ